MLWPPCPLHTGTALVSVRKRVWKSPNGETKEAWVVDYRDQRGDRHLKTFARKKDADVHHAAVAVSVRAGTHTPESRSITVAEAGELWLKASEAARLERTTLHANSTHLKLHIAPRLGNVKLGKLNLPMVRKFEDDLSERGRSQITITKVVRSLGSILSEAQERGLLAQNVVRSRRNGRGKAAERRQR